MKLILLFWPYFLVCFGVFHTCLGCICAEQSIGCRTISSDCRNGCSHPGADEAGLNLGSELNPPLLDPLAVSERY